MMCSGLRLRPAATRFMDPAKYIAPTELPHTDKVNEERAAEFKKKKYLVVPDMIENEGLLEVAYQYCLMRSRNNDMKDGDVQVPRTPVAHGDRLMETLLEVLRPRVEEATGLRLLPTYSCFRVYKKGDSLAAHTDREACEVSMTVCLGYDSDKPWPIHVGRKLMNKGVKLEPGQAVVYRGCEIQHWRDEFDGVNQAQVFLHYVDADGPYTDWIYNMRPKGLGTFEFMDGTVTGDT